MARDRKSFGESLVEEGIISLDQLIQARTEEKRSGKSLRTVLVKMGILNEEDIVSFLSDKFGLLRIELANYLIDPKIIALVPEKLAKKYQLIPVLKIGSRITCAMVDPWDVFALDEIRSKTGLIIEPAVATSKEIEDAIAQYFGVKGNMDEIIKSLDEEKLGLQSGKEMDHKKLEGIVKEPVIIKLVNMIISKAVYDGASDIHIEPEENSLGTRFRVDGLLHEAFSPPKHLQSAIISRIKILANLNISERRIPQDGRFSLKIENREIDIRVSIIPTIYGENVVMRLLNVSNALLQLEQIGFSAKILEIFSRLITQEHGIILVTGPTGSGKTTSLYTSLNRINTVEKNIITIEDPVEYKLAGIRQIQINPKVGLTFIKGLRSILRQDPDVIMVGEIRDFETAEISIQAALTGHLVFSTLHTNDAPGAITRLIDMGVEPFLISSSLIGVMAQRLVRAICTYCKEKYVPQKEELISLSMNVEEKIEFYRGKGCPKCINTGYKGRIGIYELLIPDEEIRRLIITRAPLDAIKKEALAKGLTTLKEDGIKKIKEGLTTVEEVLRVTQD